MSRPGMWSNVVLGRKVDGDYSAVSIALLKFSHGITGQNWSLILFWGFRREGETLHSFFFLPLRISPRNQIYSGASYLMDWRIFSATESPAGG